MLAKRSLALAGHTLDQCQIATLELDGAVMSRPNIDCEAVIAALASDGAHSMTSAGRRFFEAPPLLEDLLAPTGALGAIACAALSEAARPTRMIVFNKSAEANWAVAWHQDRTIAVAHRHDLPGYEVWSKKAGINHVEPPFTIMERTVSLRLHLDDVPINNAPLLTLKGSHKLGKVAAERAGRFAEECEIISHTAQAGDLLVLRTPVIHASQRASTPDQRRVLHLDFCDTALPPPLEWAFRWNDAHA